jgi:hypothetical protein
VIKINIEWQGKQGLDNLIRYIENNLLYAEAQEQVRILGHHTADKMHEIIETERKNPARPDHKLENAITAETLSTTAGVEVGIGRISTLNAEAPYWEMIDAGATYITKKTHVVPTTYFADGGSGFVTFKEGSSHTIVGIDYIGKSIRNLDKELREMMEKMGSKFIGGAEQASKGHFGSTMISKWGKRVTFGGEGSASGGAK